MEWRCVPRGQVTLLRDAKAVQQWFPEWETWPLFRRRLWGLDLLAERNILSAGAQGLTPHVSVLPSTVMPKASL